MDKKDIHKYIGFPCRIVWLDHIRFDGWSKSKITRDKSCYRYGKTVSYGIIAGQNMDYVAVVSHKSKTMHSDTMCLVRSAILSVRRIRA